MATTAVEQETQYNDAVVAYLEHQYPNEIVDVCPNCKYEIAGMFNQNPRFNCGESPSDGSDFWNMQSTCCEETCDGGNSGSCLQDNDLLPDGFVFDEDEMTTVLFIIDSGCNPSHQMFLDADNKSRVLKQFDCQDGTGGCTVKDKGFNTDDNGHGSHCAGTAGGNKYGVNPTAGIVCLKVLDGEGYGWMSDIYNAVQHVANMCDTNGEYENMNCVINMSLLGGGCPDVGEELQNAVKAGVTVIVAAGNDYSDAMNVNPACYGGHYLTPQHSRIDYDPSVYTGGILTIGASDINKNTQFSNYGVAVDLYAPGMDIWSAAHYSDTGLERWSGTSMACPHAVGIMSLCLTEKHDTDPSQSQKDRNTYCYERVVNCESEKIINNSAAPSGAPDTTNKALVRRYARGLFEHGDESCKQCRGPSGPPTTPPPTAPPTTPPPSTASPIPTTTPDKPTTDTPDKPDEPTYEPTLNPDEPDETTSNPDEPDEPTYEPTWNPEPTDQPELLTDNICDIVSLFKNHATKMKKVCKLLQGEYQDDGDCLGDDATFSECCLFKCSMFNKKKNFCKKHPNRCEWNASDKSCEDIYDQMPDDGNYYYGY